MLEREGLLAQLQAHWADVRAGPGRMLFVEGEAGIGKTTVLRSFAQSLRGDAPVYWGACEAMATPHPLGALEDIGRDSGGRLVLPETFGSRERHRLFVAFVDLLAERSALVVLEDVHWADDATLDLLRFAGRRIARTRSLLVASFRNDEIVPAHPLRAVLGDLATSGAARLAPKPLSLDAVRSLCEGTRTDAAELHRGTGGNPFFVTEVLASSAPSMTRVPATVQDAVLARVARLSSAARSVLDTVAIAGPRVEPWLLLDLAVAEGEAIDECLTTGVLRSDEGLFAFRHELARQAVLQAMTPTRAMSLHRLVLQALLSGDAPRAGPARLALHADGACDVAAVRHWAPIAARDAAARGAHRQAALHWARALEHTGPGGERAALLDAYAADAHMSIGVAEAITARRDAAWQWREHGQPGNAAVSLARQALLFVYDARNTEAREAMREARALVAADAGSRAAEVVLGYAAWLQLLERNYDEAIAIAEPLLAEAERRSDMTQTVICLRTIGGAKLSSGRVDEGIAQLERGLALALDANEDHLAGQLFAGLGTGCAEALRLASAESHLRKGIDYCSERDLDAPRLLQTATLAHVLLMQGHWDAAAAAADEVVAGCGATAVARISALIALGRLRARRGEPGVWAALDEARDLAADSGGASPNALAEAAWLEGREADAAREASLALPMAIAKRQAPLAAQLLWWCRLGGAEPAIPAFCAQHPFALAAAGRLQEALQSWRTAGAPYEAAHVLSLGDEAAQREALAIFASLGAKPLAERVRRGLRAAGVRGVPRGLRASTRQHPAGLTSKEVAVLELLAAGLRNKDIALRLHRSARTVDHHLESIFEKLGVATRAEAVSAAYRLNVVAADSGR